MLSNCVLFCFVLFLGKIWIGYNFFLLFFNLTILYWFCHISRRLLKVPWTARRSNQSILKEINPGYSLEGLMLNSNTLATWWETLTRWKRPWCWERLKVEGDDRGQDGWMASPTRWTWVWASSRRWWRTGKPGMLQFMGLQKVRHDLATEQSQGSYGVSSPSMKQCWGRICIC